MGAVLFRRKAWNAHLILHLVSTLLLALVDGGLARMLRLGWSNGHGNYAAGVDDPTSSEMEIAEVVHHDKYYMMKMMMSRRGLQQQAPTYCVANPSASQAALQAGLDWACSASGGNADCSALQTGGACENPATLVAHASYAFDYYYVKQNGASGSCDFGGAATPTTTNPSSGSCVYPSVGNGGNNPATSPTTSGTNSTTLTPSIGGDNTTTTTFGSPPTTTTGTTSAAAASAAMPYGSSVLCAVVVMLLLLAPTIRR